MSGGASNTSFKHTLADIHFFYSAVFIDFEYVPLTLYYEVATDGQYDIATDVLKLLKLFDKLSQKHFDVNSDLPSTNQINQPVLIRKITIVFDCENSLLRPR